MPASHLLNVLYTQRLRGDLDLLPRLHSFLRRLRGRLAGDDGARVLLLDLGESCVDGAWACDATDGRAVLVGLDAMGFSAANISGVLDAASRAKLAPQVSLGLLDAADPGGTVYATGGLRVDLAPAEATRMTGDGAGPLLRLAALEDGGQVGVARVTLAVAGDSAALVEAAVHSLPPGTSPDPTLAGVVDFIRDEARFYTRRRGDAPG